MDRGSLVERLGVADGLLSMLTDRIDASLLDRAPNLRIVANHAVGVDNIDLAACRRRGIAVGNTPDVLTDSTADLAFGLVLAASRRLQEGIEHVRSGAWGPWSPDLLLGHDVTRSTLGIVGFGRVGQAVATRALGFDMEVLYVSRNAKSDAAGRLGATRVGLDECLRRSDHVVVAVPLNEETRGLIGSEQLAAMKATANLVNIARGPVVDTEALYEALHTGQIRCAGLDVTDPEPFPADHPLALLPNCTIVPHIGSATVRTRTAMADMAVDNLIAFFAGEPMPSRIV